MGFFNELIGLGRSGEPSAQSNNGLVSISSENTASSAIERMTDGGEYMTFDSYWEDIRPELRDVDHIGQKEYYCALIKLGIAQKRGNSFLPPEEHYSIMKNQNGLLESSFYRKRTTKKIIDGVETIIPIESYGLSFERIGDFNTTHKIDIINTLQSLEDELDDAWEEAEAIAEVLKERWRATKPGKPRVMDRVKAMFKADRTRIIHEHLGC